MLGRHDKRHRVRSNAVDLRLLKPVRGKIVDVSGLGIGVESGRALKVRQEYKFLVRRGVTIRRLRGHVQWCALRHSSQADSESLPLVFRVGIALDDLRPHDWTFLKSSLQASKPPEK